MGLRRLAVLGAGCFLACALVVGTAAAADAPAKPKRVDWAFRDLPSPTVACDPVTTHGTIRALLVGIEKYDDHPALEGAGNDIRSLTSALATAGADPKEIRLLTGRVTYKQLAEQAEGLVRAVQCGDHVFVHFSGHAQKMPRPSFAESRYRILTSAHDSFPIDTLGRADLIKLVRGLRVRGANVWLSVDSNDSSGLEIASGLNEDFWRWARRSHEVHPGDLGSFTGFYSGNYKELILPQGDGNRRVQGVFTYALATAISNDGAGLTPRQLAERVEQTYMAFFPDSKPAIPAFESTAPDMPVLPARGDGKMRGPQARIELTEPITTRGANVIPTALLRVSGRVVSNQPLKALTVNAEKAQITKDGRFSVDVNLRKGKQRLFITAVLQRGDIVSDSVEIIHQPDRQSTLKGRRYALLIANQSYVEARYERLQTPVADVEALARLLRERFGFVTELAEDSGGQRSLVLKDATARQILSTINRIRQALREEDSLLIYYAGHGWKNDRLEQAYWLPVDAEYEDLSSWISAQQVSDQLKLMNARHVLVVSDSCYSGGMFRGNEAERPSGANELAVIAQLENRRSRLVITSGSNEPVADGGGGGHSVFARALIDALGAVADKPIASETLFSQSVRMRVLGYSRQAPQMRPVANTGHEGGDFVFWPLKARQ